MKDADGRGKARKKEQPVGSSVTRQAGRVVEVVNNKLIRNGSKIAMDERADEQGPGQEGGKKKKKANHGAVSCEPHPLCGD